MERGTLTPEEAAQYLALHPDTVRRLLRKGELPGRKVGRQWRISREALDRFIEGAKTYGLVTPEERRSSRSETP